MKQKREFLGTNDSQKIVLRSAFSKSPLVVVSPIETGSRTCLQVEGPKDHLMFLYSFLLMLVKQTPYDPSFRWGTWTGVEGFEETGKLTLFYQYGLSLMDRIQLLEHHFRRDIAFYCDLKLAEVSFLDVVLKNKEVLYNVVVGLPEELERNGSIEFPFLPVT